MQIIKTTDYQELSSIAAQMVASQIRGKPNSVLGLATGSTPLGLYSQLTDMHREAGLDFSQVVTFNLDEYYPIAPSDPASYSCYMEKNFFQHVNVQRSRCHLPNGAAADVQQACRDYEEEIDRAGGIDLQILGIGANGHIGFNEPSERLQIATHLVPLTEATRMANSRFFASLDAVPRQAISVGMAAIFRARQILLLASGESKGEAVRETVSGVITTRIPATLLQVHPNATLIFDAATISF